MKTCHKPINASSCGFSFHFGDPYENDEGEIVTLMPGYSQSRIFGKKDTYRSDDLCESWASGYVDCTWHCQWVFTECL